MLTFRRNIVIALTSLFLSNCAVLHHVQIGNVDHRKGNLTAFDIKVSELGVSLEEIGGIARATQTQVGKDVDTVSKVLALFQVGPKTGKPIYNEQYAEKVIHLIYEKCPSGKVTGLKSIRESRSYPVISGEIVKVTGYCINQEKSS